MLRILLIFSLASFSAPSWAIYKCESGGATLYTEAPCPGGKSMHLSDSGNPADAAQAQQQTAKEKKELARLETARHKREAIEEKEQERASRAAGARQKKCASLAQRKKWMMEDAANATGKSAAKANLKVRRMAEKYELECG